MRFHRHITGKKKKKKKNQLHRFKYKICTSVIVKILYSILFSDTFAHPPTCTDTEWSSR